MVTKTFLPSYLWVSSDGSDSSDSSDRSDSNDRSDSSDSSDGSDQVTFFFTKQTYFIKKIIQQQTSSEKNFNKVLLPRTFFTIFFFLQKTCFTKKVFTKKNFQLVFF